MNNIWKRGLALLLAIVMVVGYVPMGAFAEETTESDATYTAAEDETPTQGYILTIYNADGSEGMKIDGTNSVSDFCLRSAIADARTFANNAMIFGLTTPCTYVVEMYEDSTEDESFEIGSDVTVNGNGYKIVCDEGVTVTNNGTLNDATIESAAGSATQTPSGTITCGYTAADCIWGEATGNAAESFVIKVLDASGNVMGTSSLNNVDGIINGDVYVTWRLLLNAAANTDAYWTMEWTTAPTIDNKPASVALYVDGEQVATNEVQLNGADSINKIVAVVTDANGVIASYATTLQAAFDAVQDGGTITVLSDITIDESTRYNSGNNWYEGVYYEGDKSFTIDLGGHKLTNDSSVNDYLMLFKNVGEKANTITIKNGTVEAASSAYCAICTSGGSTQQITIDLEDVNVIGNNSYGSVVKVRAGTVLNVKSGTVITGTNSYLGIESYNATTNIYDGAEIYQNGTSSDNGCLVGVGGGGTVNVYGGYGKGAKGGFIAMTSGGTINVSGGEWIANTDGTVGNNSNLYVLTAQNNKNESGYKGASVINVTGGTFYGGMDAWVLNDATVEKAELNISGGKFNSSSVEAYLVDGCELSYSGGMFTVKVAPVAIVNGSTYTSLQEAVDAANGATVYLQRDVTLTETVTVTGNVTLDLKGYTVTNATTAPITIDGGVLTLKDSGTTGAIVAASTSSNNDDKAAILFGTNGGKFVMEGGTLQATKYAVRAYNVSPEIVINGGKIEAESYGVYANRGSVTMNGGEIVSNFYGIAAYGTFTMNDGKITAQCAYGSNGTYDDTVAVINGGELNGTVYEAIYWPSAGSLTINGGTITGVNAVYVRSGSLSITGGTLTGTGDGETALTIESIGSSGYQAIENISVTGGTFVSNSGPAVTSITDTTGSNPDAVAVTGFISGGSFSSDVTELCTAGLIAELNEDGTYGIVDDPYSIKDLEELKAFRDAVNAGTTYKGITITLLNDIDLGSEEWTPIGNSTNKFQGTFDGNGKTVSNLVITGSNSNVGLFGYTVNGEIKNLTVNNAQVSGYLNVGVVAGTPYTSKYTNINVTGHVEVNGFCYVGGVGGKNAYADWTNITVDVDSTSYVNANSVSDEYTYRSYVGGVIGFIGEGSHTFSNISSNIAVIGSTCDIGGLFGIAHYGNKFVNVSCSASVSCTGEADEIGGIAGVWNNKQGQTVTFTGATFTGTVSDMNGTVTGCDIVGGAYTVSNDTVDNSGSLIIDGVEQWLKVAQIGDTKYTTLQAAFDAVQDGDTINILSDVTITQAAATVTGSWIDGVRYKGDKSFTVDFGGHTVTDDGCVNDYVIYVWNAGSKANEITFQNGTIVSKNGCWATVCVNANSSTMKSVLNLNDMTVINSNGTAYAGNEAVRAREVATVNVNDGTTVISDNASYGVAGTTQNSTVNINSGATVIQKNSVNPSGNHTCAAVSCLGVLNIYDGAVITSDNDGVHPMTSANPVVNIYGGTITAPVALFATTNGYSYQSTTINVYGGTITGTLETPYTNGYIRVSGGTFSVDPSAYCVDGFTGALNQETGMYSIVVGNLIGSGTEADPYQIKNIDDLIFFRDSVNAGETTYNAAGVYVALADDIDLAGIDWSVNIGDDCNATFDGIFDGKGYTISNLTAIETAQKGDGYVCSGLFGAIYGTAVIKNLTIENVTINTGAYTGNNVGAVVGFAYSCTGSVENVTVKGDINISASGISGVGGIVGYDYYGKLTVKDCSVIGNDGSAITGAAYVGGIIGYASSNSTLSNNTVQNVTVSGKCCVGGVAGLALGGTTASGNTVKNTTLSASHENWQNSVAVVIGTISGGSVNVSDTTAENVTGATALVGSEWVKSPSEPVGAVAAAIGNTYYTTLEAAIAAAQSGDTIDLLVDIDASECIMIDKSLTINGNGHKVTSSASRVFRVTASDVTVTLNDVNMVSTAVRSGTNDIRGISIDGPLSNVTLNLNNCSVVFTDASANDWSYAVNVSGGSTEGIAVNVNGGTYEGANVINVYKTSAAAVTVTDATLNCLYGESDMYYGYCITAWHEDSTVNATGNIFNGDNAVAISADDVTESNNIDNTKYYVAKIGTTYYYDLAEAVAVAQAGDTVYMTQDVELSAILVINKAITLDGNDNTLTSTAARAINVSGADGVTIQDLTVNCSGERAINIIQNATNVTIDNVTATAGNYTVNVASSAPDAVVAITNSDLTGLNVINVAAENASITVTGTELNVNDPSSAENYAALNLNKDATGATITASNCTFVLEDDSIKANNAAENGVITIDGSAEDVRIAVAYIAYDGGDHYAFTTLQSAINKATANDTIVLIRDIELSETVKVTGTAVLDLNGYSITGTDNATGSFALIQINPGADLTVNDSDGNGKITLTATNERNWNAYSAVISNQRGKLTVNGGTIEHLGGTAMAYAIDNLTNTGAQIAETVINGGTIKSTYRAIRMFLNSSAEGVNNILTVNGGTIEGANKSIWMQDANKSANVGTLTVGEDAVLKGDVYLFVTAGSTEWPVTVSIDAAALAEGYTVLTGNVPEAYIVELSDGTWGVRLANYVASVTDADGNVTKYESLAEAFAAAQNGYTVTLLSDLTIDSETYTIADGVSVTLDMNGMKLTVTDNKTTNYELFYIYGGLTVTGNGTIELTATTDRDWNAMSAIFHNRGGELTIENGTFQHLGGTDMAYVVDNSGNWFGDATTVINDGTLTSTYTAIRNRMEQNSHGYSGTAYLTVNGGTITGDSRAIWAQAASTSTTAPATGEININGGTIGLIRTAWSDGAECMTTISGGTVEAFTGEVNELTVTGGTVDTVTILNASGEAAEYVITSEGLYAQAVAQIGETNYLTLQAAAAAAEDGATIDLLFQPAATDYAMVKKNLTINKNGFEAAVAALSGYTVEETDTAYVVLKISELYNELGEALAYVDTDNDGEYDETETLLTLQEALDAAGNGEVVRLTGNIELGTIILPTGVTLDLDSYSLTADRVIGLNGSYLTANYMASSTNSGSGILKAEKDNVKLANTCVIDQNTGYGLLPVWNSAEGHYEFTLARVYAGNASHGLKVTEDQIYFQFKHQVGKYYKENLLNDGGLDNGVKVILTLSYQNESGTAEQTFVYNDTFFQTVNNASNMDYTFTLKNYEDIGVDLSYEVTITVAIVTDCGMGHYLEPVTVTLN